MKTTSSFYQYSGLIAALGLLALVVGLVVMVLLPDIRYAAWVLLALGVLLLAGAFIIDFRRVSRAITGRRGRFSTGTTVMVFIVIGITLLVNAVSIGTWNHRFDVTALAEFTLTSQTKDVLSKMETPVKVLCFFIPDDPYGITTYATSLLTEYQNYTDKLSTEFIDPDKHPDQAKQYNITEYESVVFETKYGRRLVSPEEIIVMDDTGQTVVGFEAEHAFTSAILEVTGIVQKKVYFLTGHGENSITGDYSYAKESLLDNLYKVGTLDLLFTHSIPEDCAALIIAGPTKSLDKSEVEIIKNYLENDGWVMILANPNSPPEIGQLLSSWGVDIGDGTIVDPSSYDSNLGIDSVIVPRSRDFFQLTNTCFPGATAIIPQPGYTPQAVVTQEGMPQLIYWTSENSSLQLYSLLRTSEDSWLEKNFSLDKKPEFNEGTDLKGPLNIGFLIIPTPPQQTEGQSTEQTKKTRLIVIGDSDFASDKNFYNGDNGNLFLNSIELLTAGKELISLERKVLPFRELVVTQAVTSFIQISSIGLLPLLVLIAGGVIWWRRR
jgi:ABC-type uncharacterized transport system involved in gliding motility auxiliary subunit